MRSSVGYIAREGGMMYGESEVKREIEQKTRDERVYICLSVLFTTACY